MCFHFPAMEVKFSMRFIQFEVLFLMLDVVGCVFIEL